MLLKNVKIVLYSILLVLLNGCITVSYIDDNSIEDENIDMNNGLLVFEDLEIREDYIIRDDYCNENSRE